MAENYQELRQAATAYIVTARCPSCQTGDMQFIGQEQMVAMPGHAITHKLFLHKCRVCSQTMLMPNTYPSFRLEPLPGAEPEPFTDPILPT